jgi:uncharacterized membrane protein YfcA
METSFDVLALLGLAAFAAGFVDGIAGGGGLITIPALLLAGLDPVAAIATNKLQGVFSTGSALTAYMRRGLVAWRTLPLMLAAALIAGACGAAAVRHVPTDWLRVLVPILLTGAALYFAFSPSLTDTDAQKRLGLPAFTALLVSPVAFYDGFFGPGAGSFYMLGIVGLLGFGVLRASAKTKALNFASNLASVGYFLSQGLAVWTYGLVMAVAGIAGAQVGTRLAIRHGVKIIKPMLVIICLAVAVRLLLDPSNPLRIYWANAF